jgi:peptide/nickel transport system substrate-binding protein
MSAMQPRLMNRRAAVRLLLGGSGLAILAACSPSAPTTPAATQAPAAAKPAEATRPAAAAPPASGPAPVGGSPAAASPVAGSPVAASPVAAASPAASAASAAPAPAAAAKPTGAQPKSGGTLRIGQAGDIVNFDPHFYQFASSESVWLAYDRLIQYDLKFQPQPMLAESWDVSSDAKQIKFNLRKGVQFHSGREMTSDDVKWTLERIKDPKIGVGQFAAQATWFPTVETPDKNTIILKSDEPRPLMFDFFELLNIVDRTVLEGPDAQTKDSGTGPFVLTERAQGDRAVWQKNKSYWQSGKPYLDAVELKIGNDSQAMMTQLEAGAQDVMRTPTKQDFARLSKDPKYQGVVYPATVSGYAVGINTKTPPLTDKRVRQALSYAVDRKRYVDQMLAGVGKPVSLPWAEGFPMYDAEKANHYTFDLDKAKALLGEAGVSDLAIEILISPAYPEASDFCQMYQSDLAKIGVKLSITRQETAAWSDSVNNRKYPHLYYAGSILNLSPGTIFTVSRPVGPKNNNEGFENDHYVSLVNTLASEMDPAKLKPIYAELNDILLDEAFFNFMSPNLVIMVASAKVHDFTPTMHGRWLLTDTWLE